MSSRILFTLSVILLIQAACSISTSSPLNSTQELATSTVILPTKSAVLVINTNTPFPTVPTITTVASVVPTSASTAPNPDATSGVNTVKIYMIAINDNGARGKEIGCGDSIVGVDVPITPTPGVLQAALTKLLSIKTRYFGGESDLYDALYQSDLTVDSLAIQNGLATIRLSGTMMIGGVCDAPRLQAQLEQTVLQFSTIKQVDIFINDKPLSEVLSSK